MTVITLTTGLPASGKSTWAKEEVKNAGGRISRVNLDDIRTMLGFGPLGTLEWTKELEQDALAVQDAAILAAVAQGKDVIVDNTHLNSRTPNRIKKLFDGEITFKVKDFTNVWATECVRRDAERENSVGSEVIYRMAKQLQKPWRLTEAYMNDIVVDIDGTLARHDHRSPYDYSKVLTDGVHEHIRDIVTKYYEDDYFVLVVSGRPDSCEQDTYKWLYHNRIPFDDVFMRKTGDQRNDADIKHEIFNRHIRNQYDVRIWLDDRDRVVRRMRKLGINVLQVAEGKF
jgi:predicted kinase